MSDTTGSRTRNQPWHRRNTQAISQPPHAQSLYKLKMRYNTLWKESPTMITLSHCCRNPSIIFALPILVSASSPTPTAIYPCLARPKSSPPWVGGVIVSMTPLRSFALVLCCQIYRCGLLYILLKYAKMRSRRRA